MKDAPLPDPLADDLLDGLNAAQRDAVTRGDGPLLIVAGPGSGKTRVVSRRVAWLLRHGVRSDQILAVTFTNKAAGELKDRVRALCASAGIAAGGLWVSTFHSACARILRENHGALGYPSSFTIYDEEDRRRLAGRVLRELGVPAERLKAGAFVRWISNAKNAGRSPEDAARAAWGPREEELAKGYAHYEKLLVEAAAMDFDDLLLRTHRLLEGNPAVLARYTTRLTHVLVDEYQDTNRVQFLLAKALASGTGNLCATGDPDQSIYGWRGADIRNILDFQQHYPAAAVVRLEDNYRSTENILGAADRLIKRNASRHEKDLRGRGDSGPQVRVEIFPGADEEGEAVGAAIRDLIDGGMAASGVAVLYRVNARSRAVEKALIRRSIPYQVVRGVEFFQRAEVKDLVAWLRLLANPRDAEAFVRVLEAPKRGAGPVARGKVLEEATRRGIPVRDALLLGSDVLGAGGKAGKALDLAGASLRRLLEPSMDGVGRLLERVVEEAGYRRWLEENWPEDHQERWENVTELMAAAAAHDLRDAAGGGLTGFLEEVALVSDQDRWDADAPRVTLMTLHACKGLEFPAVFLVGVEEGVLPHSRAAKDEAGFEDAAGIEEERRLLFVGMTRAERCLWLSAGLRASGWTGGMDAGPSRFLEEIGREGVRWNRHAAPVPAPSPSSPGSSSWRSRRSEVRDPDFMDSLDGPPPETVARMEGNSFRVGMRVRHAKFGTGRLRRLEQHGPVVYATVEFREGMKKLDLEKARLEPLGEPSRGEPS